MAIHELRILPPLAIARLGSSSEPLENYELVVSDSIGFREIRACETLKVDAGTGAISEAYKPAGIRFRDGDQIRPVAPFIEVFARTDEETLEPLTIDLLAAEGLAPEDVRWNVSLGNIKAYRRTGDVKDKIRATVDLQGHGRVAIEGQCPNFLPNKSLPLGSAQYIRPTVGFPEIRMRYTPAQGLVYGASDRRVTADGPSGPISEPDPVIGDRIVYDGRAGRWLGYFDRGEPTETNPGAIYAGYADRNGNQVSWGYLDDECDGIVSVSLDVGGRTLRAFGRLGVGPPSFAPDGLPIRTVADDLEQAMFGPVVSTDEATQERVEDIVRRAYETVRLLNTAVMNGNPVDGRLAVASIMPAQDANDYHRLFEPIMASTLVDTFSLLQLHQAVLTALRSGTPPWFLDVLRQPEEIGDLSDKGRRKMPGMMRGADARYLTLTRRQIDIVRQSIARGLFS